MTRGHLCTFRVQNSSYPAASLTQNYLWDLFTLSASDWFLLWPIYNLSIFLRRQPLFYCTRLFKVNMDGCECQMSADKCSRVTIYCWLFPRKGYYLKSLWLTWKIFWRISETPSFQNSKKIIRVISRANYNELCRQYFRDLRILTLPHIPFTSSTA